MLTDAGKRIEADLLGIADVTNKSASKAKVIIDEDTLSDATMAGVERNHIKKVFESCEGNRTHAAKKARIECKNIEEQD